MTNRAFHGMVVAVMVVTLVYPSLSSGENVSPGSDAHSMTDPNKDPQGLLAQITDLQAEVAKLRAAVQQTDPMKRSSAGSRMKMGGDSRTKNDFEAGQGKGTSGPHHGATTHRSSRAGTLHGDGRRPA